MSLFSPILILIAFLLSLHDRQVREWEYLVVRYALRNSGLGITVVLHFALDCVDLAKIPFIDQKR